MWRAEAPADSGDQQLSGAAMLAQLVPHMRVAEVSVVGADQTTHELPFWCLVPLAPKHNCIQLLFLLLLSVLQAPLYTSPHWVLSIACPVQHTEAGVEQGAFVALAQQPLQHVSTCRLVQHARLAEVK